MTKKLYYESAYLKDWHTSVSQVVEREDGLYLILEETAFYPHGGGQPCDAGTIGGIPVLDVILEENVVLHKVESLPAGSQVSCQLDWNRRFDHMQQHSGQHLLSAVFRELFQAMTLSFHLGNDYATIDLELRELTPDQLAAAEQEVNRQVVLDRNIVSYFVTPEEMASLPLVKLPKVTENIRIVEIEGVEHNACGGTHVSSTGAIGMIKLLRAEKQKGNIRITFKCGGRALDEANDNQRILSALSAKFNTGKDEILDRIGKWEAEQKQLQAEMAVLREQNDIYMAKELLSGLEPETRVVAHIFADKSLKDLQSLATKLTANTELPVLLLTAMENKAVLACSGSAGLSCGAFFKAHLGEFQGKGGGSDKMAQAGFPAWDEVLKFYEFAKVNL
ncbi:alanyl-tRNA editing protein [Paenibacillus riograndensis]|uniref:Threonyl/alanyl tRNA synthetase SAD n=1 Tax=Paenibacillus riograndensis SBR5 TaxID=1073571 RepID=A0A0E4HB50_9BACL|nr:alanyl-tRNA editing protein [Paenibacillus riograndensis]CQR55800.1 threonyl/alanyl tRNA synthetase SAD [Paenibacillus riograndensis SBR5]